MSVPPRLFNRLGGMPRPCGARAEAPRRVDVAVVGAGVVGLSVGWRLALRGLAVALFDAGAAGEGTSAAATGMLAAGAEHEAGGEALLRLALESQALWPGFRDALETEAGASIDYRREGTLVLAVGRDETERLRFRHDLQRRDGLDTHWLPGSAARDKEPGLRAAVTAGIFCPHDHQVDPPRLIAALKTAFRRAGGALCEGVRVEGLERCRGRVSGLRLAGGGEVGAASVVLAPGAAIAALPWLPEALHVPVRPLKGQAMALRVRHGPPLIDHVVWTADIHLAPKSDGRMILGATMEEDGFDPSLTAGGLFSLIEAARRVLPGIEEMAVEDLWSGFRPTSDDDAPILGPTPVDGLLIAAGHHRNGYLLAPVTARAIEDLIMTGAMRGAAPGFGLARFAPPPPARRPLDVARGR